jgi:nitroreductase
MTSVETAIPPTKNAPTEHAVHPLLRARWSPRAFTPQALTDEELDTLFEAATWAPSSSNEQPWRFVYAHRHDEAAFQRLLDCLVPANQAWAKDAAVLVLSLARTTFAGSGKPNKWAWHDVGAATTSLLLQATAQGLHGHVMGGFDNEKTRAEFALPDDVEAVSFIALGHLGSPDQLEEPYRTREHGERKRKPVAEVTFAGQPSF